MFMSDRRNAATHLGCRGIDCLKTVMLVKIATAVLPRSAGFLEPVAWRHALATTALTTGLHHWFVHFIHSGRPSDNQMAASPEAFLSTAYWLERFQLRIVRHWRITVYTAVLPGITRLHFQRSDYSTVAALAGGADPRMKWFASSVFWKASIVCSPSFCMNGHADQ